MWERYFSVADQVILITGRNSEGDIFFPDGLRGFEKVKLEKLPLLTLKTGVTITENGSPAKYTFLFDELNLTCEFSAAEKMMEFRMLPDMKMDLPMHLKKSPVLLKMPRGASVYSTNLIPSRETISEFSFLLWNAYGVAAAPDFSLAVHSSVIIYREKAVLFLGESGTGKSTHTHLWLKTIPDCMLLNDDSPIVRIMEDNPVCFGSPWSGKSKCYLDDSFPVEAIVRLKQAPFNRMKKLNKIEAFAALYPSCPPSFSIDSQLTDYVCRTISKIIEKVPVYTLECLPDPAAAQLSFATIFK